MSKLTITIVIEEFKTVFKLLKVENYNLKNYLKIVMTILTLFSSPILKCILLELIKKWFSKIQ
jgi:hypothetical protein